jgi:3-hydroxyisobutyrate dehydrogenase-like beta-hydroxyacid dehydrogenase
MSSRSGCEDIMKVAFIGLGHMGSAIAGNIARHGFDLTVWNRSPGKIEPLLALGAKGADSARAAAAEKDVIITSLMDDRSVLETLEGEQGILAGMKPGSIHLCVTTISPSLADDLARRHLARGTLYVSGPVMGRPDVAAAGQLLTYLAGDPSAVAAVIPPAQAFSRAVRVVSAKASDANIVKLGINYSIVSLIELMGEVYAFSEKSGIDAAILKDFFQTVLAHPGLKQYAGNILERNFPPGGFAMTGGLKDVGLMLEAAAQSGAPLKIGGIIKAKMQTAIAQGMGEQDWAAIYEITRREAGLGWADRRGSAG